jgi:hypothetical protein
MQQLCPKRVCPKRARPRAPLPLPLQCWSSCLFTMYEFVFFTHTHARRTFCISCMSAMRCLVFMPPKSLHRCACPLASAPAPGLGLARSPACAAVDKYSLNPSRYAPSVHTQVGMASSNWSDLEPIQADSGVCLCCCGQILPEALQVRTICTHASRHDKQQVVRLGAHNRIWWSLPALLWTDTP